MAASVRRIKLGSQGLEVSAQGLGCMGMSAFYGPPKPEEDMVQLIHHAIGSGITFLDTSDVYGPHTNEILLGKALNGGWKEKVELATKFGIQYADEKATIRGDPAYVRACCEASLERLNVDCIDLYYQHRIDNKIPIEVTMGELKKLSEEGKIKYIGLSEASASTIRRAHAVHPVGVGTPLYTFISYTPYNSGPVGMVFVDKRFGERNYSHLQGTRDWDCGLQSSRQGLSFFRAEVDRELFER